ncbi:glycine zipper 2TM domain-containing protein [Lysobacter sp. A6]|uniref:Glycine zipper 2TM domain-containing protein n=1 Tax=Noviluteimonas lactosilytica TaxID=2888523 RepID=A0ABS8JDT1_9GAMM|nr:glycine zipper 2TM domain-containing protein [Lysobacter lactosilyticus]MCC8361775.1 glycine zipper 2TM domain-containing protein [Lysobacter lactosilyticus]
MLKNNTLAVALAALLVGGVATAAFMNNRDKSDVATDVAPPASLTTATAADDAALDETGVPASGRVEYADVVDVKPITKQEKLYAQVIGTEPIKETSTTSTPREVCQDVVVEERAPERDGNVGGTVAGAIVGGLLGNQVGSGDGKKAATVAGAVAGGFAGREIDKRHVGGKVTQRTDRQCHTETSTSSSSKTVAWNVTYRNPDGTTGTMRTGDKPGSRISLGTEDRTVGYDVTYSYDGQQRTVRMDDKPGARLPVIDGQVVTQVASASGSNENG